LELVPSHLPTFFISAAVPPNKISQGFTDKHNKVFILYIDISIILNKKQLQEVSKAKSKMKPRK